MKKGMTLKTFLIYLVVLFTVIMGFVEYSFKSSTCYKYLVNYIQHDKAFEQSNGVYKSHSWWVAGDLNDYKASLIIKVHFTNGESKVMTFKMKKYYTADIWKVLEYR